MQHLDWLKLYEVPGETKILLIDSLFDVSLFAFYVVEIQEYKTTDVEGSLMTPPFEFYGPFDTYEEADKLMQTLCEGDANLA